MTYSYLWAAAQSEQFASVSGLMGNNQSKISPVELYYRVDSCGKFRFKGTPVLVTVGSANHSCQ